jgi:hypothetical protein
MYHTARTQALVSPWNACNTCIYVTRLWARARSSHPTKSSHQLPTGSGTRSTSQNVLHQFSSFAHTTSSPSFLRSGDPGYRHLTLQFSLRTGINALRVIGSSTRRTCQICRDRKCVFAHHATLWTLSKNTTGLRREEAIKCRPTRPSPRTSLWLREGDGTCTEKRNRNHQLDSHVYLKTLESHIRSLHLPDYLKSATSCPCPPRPSFPS